MKIATQAEPVQVDVDADARDVVPVSSKRRDLNPNNNSLINLKKLQTYNEIPLHVGMFLWVKGPFVCF